MKVAEPMKSVPGRALVAAVRPMRFEEIGELARAVWDSTSTAQIEARWRESQLGYREILVAEVDGRIVGTVSMHDPRPGSMHLFALDVGPEWRNRGVGRTLVEHVVAQAALRGMREVFLEVRVDNPARRLYHRLGFRRVGQPFDNGWWRYDDAGGRERVEETSLKMVKRLASGRRGSRSLRADAVTSANRPGG